MGFRKQSGWENNFSCWKEYPVPGVGCQPSSEIHGQLVGAQAKSTPRKLGESLQPRKLSCNFLRADFFSLAPRLTVLSGPPSPGGHSLIWPIRGRAAGQGMVFGLLCPEQGIQFYADLS